LRAEATRILNQFEFGPVYYPPSERGTAVLPGAVGGASWSGAGIDPETGWIYIPSITNPQVMRLAKPKPDESDMRYVSLGANRFALNGPEGLPITKPPYGRITAIDLGSGDHRWVAPLGSGPRDHARLKALNLQPLGWPSRGFVLVTKTLLFAAQEPAIKQQLNTETNVFEKTGTTREPMLRAFDKRTGQMLADFELPANAGGSPMAFGAGDREFIVVPVGGGGIPAELIALTIGE
jgi:quinoprotein glucose dehydrogenase